MGAGSSSSLPAAIVLSSVIVATGIYLGLRERAPVHSPTTAAEPAPLAPVVAPAPVDVDRALAGEHARAAVAYARPQLLARCYRPAIAGLPAPIPAEFVLDLDRLTDAAYRTELLRRSIVVASAGRISPRAPLRS